METKKPNVYVVQWLTTTEKFYTCRRRISTFQDFPDRTYALINFAAFNKTGEALDTVFWGWKNLRSKVDDKRDKSPKKKDY